MFGVSAIAEVESRCADCRTWLPAGEMIWWAGDDGLSTEPVCLPCYHRRAVFDPRETVRHAPVARTGVEHVG